MFNQEVLRHLRNKKVVVMGLGLHGGGTATTQWLLRHGASVVVTDLRSRAVLEPSIRELPHSRRLRFVLGQHRHKDFRDADFIVANPGVPHTSPYLRTAKRAGIPIVNEATIFFLRCPCPIVGVTGTRGKSSLATFLAFALRRWRRDVVLTGNIRSAAFLQVLDRLRSASLVVAELSSWQLEGLTDLPRSPNIAVLTNLYDDHVNRYRSREEYFRAKEIIWKYQKKSDSTVLNRDNPPSRQRGNLLPGQRWWFSLKRFSEENGAFLSAGWLMVRQNGKVTRIAKRSNLSLLGNHNVANVLAGLAVLQALGVPRSVQQSAVQHFRGVPGRLELIRTVKGVEWYNDTTATSPDGVIAALTSFTKKTILIAGGVDKGFAPETYRRLAANIQRKAKRLLLLPGTASDHLVRALPKKVSVVTVDSMEAAVQEASRMARNGDRVLLSPGGASFNLFLHEFDRGDRFLRAVRRIR